MCVSYVYAYCDPRKAGIWITDAYVFNFEPFYIGEGKGDRLNHHLFQNSGNMWKINKIQKIISSGLQPIIFKIRENLYGDDALLLETSLIRQLGTRAIIPCVSRGPLTNLKINEGKKVVLSVESRNKISIKAKARGKLSLEHCKKLSVSRRGKLLSEKHKRNLSLSLVGKTRGYKRSEESCIKISKGHLGLKLSEQHKINIANSNRGKERTEETRKNISAAQKGKLHTPEGKANISAGLSRTYCVVSELDNSETFVFGITRWCKNRNINQTMLKRYSLRDKFYNGHKIKASFEIDDKGNKHGRQLLTY